MNFPLGRTRTVLAVESLRLRAIFWTAGLAFALILHSSAPASAQDKTATAARSFFIDCAASIAGDGSSAHPWNSLADAQTHPFEPGDRIALARGTLCRGSFAPQGSGTEEHPIRLTAYGHGPRPQIVAPASERQAMLLYNQEYWQVDSLDLAGGNTYGIFVSGDQGPLRHIYLKNLYVHNVYGGAMKNKDNGLVIVGPSGPGAVFSDVLVDGVDAAHTNQWSGILIGGGNFAYAADAPLNRQVTVRNSTAHDVYGDGIILFRDTESSIKTSAAWQTGMQPTQDIGTPNAIWTWTCTDCTVEDNEAFLTDSPGVDGGAYDIDWDNSRNTVQRNYAHDTQGYCLAVFAAGYVTSESVVRDNLCIDNGLSPRLAALQGAIYLHTWNEGVIRGLTMEHNFIQWNPPVAGTAAIVSDAATAGSPVIFAHNQVESTSPLIYRGNSQWAPSANTYTVAGDPAFTIGSRHNVSLTALQAVGIEAESSVTHAPAPKSAAAPLLIEAAIDLVLDEDGLLAPNTRAQLLVLRNLAGQYGPAQLKITVHLRGDTATNSEADVLRDLEDVYPGALHFNRNRVSSRPGGLIRLLSQRGTLLQEWHGFQNAATLGGAVRALLGAPSYSHMQTQITGEEQK